MFIPLYFFIPESISLFAFDFVCFACFWLQFKGLCGSMLFDVRGKPGNINCKRPKLWLSITHDCNRDVTYNCFLIWFSLFVQHCSIHKIFSHHLKRTIYLQDDRSRKRKTSKVSCASIESKYRKISNKNCNGKIHLMIYFYSKGLSLIFYVAERMESENPSDQRIASHKCPKKKMKWKRYKIYCNWYRLHSNVLCI